MFSSVFIVVRCVMFNILDSSEICFDANDRKNKLYFPHEHKVK